MKTLSVLVGLLLSLNSIADEGIKYAPRQKVVKGSPLLTCVSANFQNKKPVSASKCGSVARHTANFFKRNSRGLLTFRTKSAALALKQNSNHKNYRAAVDTIKGKWKSDYWMVPGKPGNVSNAGGKTAHLVGTLYRTGDHEVGHLLGLGHSGRYIKEKGKWHLDSYGDGSSVMGRFPSAFLTAPQYYSLGWLPENEAAMWEPGKTYTIKRTSNFTPDSGLVTVIVLPKFFFGKDGSVPSDPNQRKAFVAWPPKCFGKTNQCLALYLAVGQGGGTQKIATFGKEYYDTRFTGLHIKALESSTSQIKVSIDFAPKPSMVQEVDLDTILSSKAPFCDTMSEDELNLQIEEDVLDFEEDDKV